MHAASDAAVQAWSHGHASVVRRAGGTSVEDNKAAAHTRPCHWRPCSRGRDHISLRCGPGACMERKASLGSPGRRDGFHGRALTLHVTPLQIHGAGRRRAAEQGSHDAPARRRREAICRLWLHALDLPKRTGPMHLVFADRLTSLVLHNMTI